MRDLLALLVVQRRSLTHRLRESKERDSLVTILLGVFSGLFWLFMLGLIYLLLSMFFDYAPGSSGGLGIAAHALGKKLFSFLLMSFFLFLAFSNTLNAVAIFYINEDLQLLASLPIRRSHLFLVRYMETFLSSSWMLFIFGLPLFLAFGLYYQNHFDAPWSYYGWMILFFVPYMILPASFGMIAAFLIVDAFPAHKVRDLFILLGAFFAALLFIAFRMINPERLLRVQNVEDVIGFLEGLEVPNNFLLPSEWIASGLYDILLGIGGFHLFNWLLLLFTALATIVVTGWLHNRLWIGGFHKTQESRRVRFSRKALFTRALDGFAARLPRSVGALIAKDTRTFFRDPSQWSQMLLLGAIVAIYLMYYSKFPLDQLEFHAPFLRTAGAGSFMAYLNIAMTAFVVTSLGARFIYPTVSLEGRAYWLISSAPITTRRFLWSKFWIGFVPTLIIAEALIVGSNLMLGADRFVFIVSVLVMFGMCFVIVALGLGLGARFPNFRAENATKIAASYGGIIYMILAMAYVIFVLSALFFPARVYYEYARAWRMIPILDLAGATVLIGMLAVFSLGVILVSMRAGEKRLESLEII